ncbi:MULTISPECIES: hypothetical protein [Cupriavidus]|uniref:hypothetical protein n=1 Tax=Cupriavidus sp. KB_39 TaxID=3233036 RepID=UPI003F914A32
MRTMLRIRSRQTAILIASISLIAVCSFGLLSAAEELTQTSTSNNTHSDATYVTHVMVVVGGLVPMIVVGWFLYLFSGITISPRKIRGVIVFCYLTTGLMIIGCLLPFVVFPLAPELQRLMIASPVGVTPGCKNAADQGTVLKELACSAHTDQWIVNIGGVVERVDPLTVSSGHAQTVLGLLESAATATPAALGTKWASVQVRGGVVVPLYFVIIALMGAAISMTRSVPRCQKRLIPGQADSITPEEGREYLVLQVMQVFSAPLIAIVAYHIFEPDSARTSVILAFACGFASETILLFISAAIKKLNPEGPLPPARSVPMADSPGAPASNAASASSSSASSNRISAPDDFTTQPIAPTAPGGEHTGRSERE